MASLLVVMRFFEDGAHSDLETFLGFFDPDSEIDFSDVDRPDRRTSRGLDEIATLFREMNARWKDVHFVTTNPFSTGNQVVIDVERTARARRGGLGVTSNRTAHVTVRNDKILGLKMFRDRADALDAAGMRP